MKEIFDFLAALKDNNTREWMQENRPWYKSVRRNFEDRVNALIVSIAAHDPAVGNITAKDAVFRLARDIRFSKDKTPYKINFSASISDTGRKTEKAFYYLHIQPQNAFIACGMYLPESSVLQKVRQEIDYNGEELIRILEQPELKKHFGELQRFPEQRLKTAPRGYEKDHRFIDLLRNKSFILSKPLKDEFFVQEDWIEQTASLLAHTKAFKDWLNVVFEDID